MGRPSRWPRIRLFCCLLLGLMVGAWLFHSPLLRALNQTDSDSLQVTARVEGPAPTTPATIESPPTNTTVTVTPMVVRGSCGPGLIVRVYIDGVLAGTTDCALDSTFSVNVTLHIGHNILTVLNFDTIDQPGPASPEVIVVVLAPEAPTTPGSAPTITKQPGRRTGPTSPVASQPEAPAIVPPNSHLPPNPLHVPIPEFQNPVLRHCLTFTCWLLFFEIAGWVALQLIGFLLMLVVILGVKRRSD